MSVQFNRVMVAGNLTMDPRLKQVGENQVCDFSIAVNERYKTKGGEQKEDVSFIDITVWGYAASNCDKYLSKGSSVLVEGKLKQESWEKDGEKRSKLKIVASSVQFLDSKPKSEKQESAPAEDGAPSNLPF